MSYLIQFVLIQANIVMFEWKKQKSAGWNTKQKMFTTILHRADNIKLKAPNKQEEKRFFHHLRLNYMLIMFADHNFFNSRSSYFFYVHFKLDIVVVIILTRSRFAILLNHSSFAHSFQLIEWSWKKKARSSFKSFSLKVFMLLSWTLSWCN